MAIETQTAPIPPPGAPDERRGVESVPASGYSHRQARDHPVRAWCRSGSCSTAGFVNELALLEMVDAVHARVRAALHEHRFPVLYGGDCAVLLGAVPALRDVGETAGLLFVDGHEDAATMEQSTTGEAANMEIALLLGMTGDRAPQRCGGFCRPFDLRRSRCWDSATRATDARSACRASHSASACTPRGRLGSIPSRPQRELPHASALRRPGGGCMSTWMCSTKRVPRVRRSSGARRWLPRLEHRRVQPGPGS